LALTDQITAISKAIAIIRQLRRIHPYLDSTADCTIVTSIIHFKLQLDYCNTLYYNLHSMLAVLAFRCTHGMAPPYLARELRRVADMHSRRRLRSASTFELNIPPTCRVTVGDRAFGVAAAHVWNSLPSGVTASPSLSVFKRRLKTSLFSRSFDL